MFALNVVLSLVLPLENTVTVEALERDLQVDCLDVSDHMGFSCGRTVAALAAGPTH